MSREIRFKAWDNNLKVMEYDVHLLDRFAEILARGQYTVLQYTGRRDKQGNEVFEGDVLAVFMDRLGDSYPFFSKNDYILCEVAFENGGFHAINYKEGMQFPLWALAPDSFDRMGNIYQDGI